MDFALSETDKEMWEKATEFTRRYITPKAHELEKRDEFPMEIVQKAYEQGFMNLHIPKEAGGPGHTLLTETMISEATGYGCAGMATSIMCNNLAFAPLVIGATIEQLKKYVKPLITGEKVKFGAFSLTERVAGSDLVPMLAEAGARYGWRIYFLGAAPGVAETTAQILSQRFPGLDVAGTYSGSPAKEEEDDIVHCIQASHADLVFVAYGAPKQDLWLYRNLARTGAKVGVGVGGSFDFIAGVQKRAPRWIQHLGMEWFYRLIREPWRWRRQLALPKFVWLVLSGRV